MTSYYDRWVVQPPLSTPGLHPIIGPILSARGINDPEERRRFLEPRREDLHDPAGIFGIDVACDRIARAIRDREAILIYGDYDVDGVTSIVLLRTVLKSLGADVDYVVPHRLVDGYGLKIEVIERVLVERNVRLVITVDCGISSVEPVQKAIERGIDVIITDHHLPPGVLPEAAALLNPKIDGCTYPFKDLAGVGVAFKLCCELLRRNGGKVSIDSLLKIAAIGTIADVAPLVGENRTIARLGLDGLVESSNPGLRTLLRIAGVYGRRLRAQDVGFKLGPRINAAGRLASADTAIRLFSARSDEEAFTMVMELNRLNSQRQSIEQEVLRSAEELIDPAASIHILAAEGWHKGVLGLCAGRLAQKYHRPTLMIGIDGDRCVGSARSIQTIDLHGELDRVRELFTHFGGHEFACGFSLEKRNLEELKRRLRARFDSFERPLFERSAMIAATVALSQLDAEFLRLHEQLEPFGAGNAQPLFVVRGARAGRRRQFADDCYSIETSDGTGSAEAMLWPSRRNLAAQLTEGALADLVVRVEPGRRGELRLEIEDAAPAGTR